MEIEVCSMALLRSAYIHRPWIITFRSQSVTFISAFTRLYTDYALLHIINEKEIVK